jgi:hypothetical protein
LEHVSSSTAQCRRLDTASGISGHLFAEKYISAGAGDQLLLFEEPALLHDQ